VICDLEGGIVKTHFDLNVWKESIKLVKEIYFITTKFPQNEVFGLTSQIKRAVISVPSNIAEGASRQTNREFIQFLYIAIGSLSEVETQLIIAKELNFIKQKDIQISLENIINIKKMINGLIKYLKVKNEK
jgi:four helix bundle protein